MFAAVHSHDALGCHADIGGARTFATLADLILDHLAFSQLLDPSTLNLGMMEKQVVASLSFHKPKTPIRYQSLDLTLWHFCTPQHKNRATRETGPPDAERKPADTATQLGCTRAKMLRGTEWGGKRRRTHMLPNNFFVSACHDFRDIASVPAHGGKGKGNFSRPRHCGIRQWGA
jgi:hypothetical protein